jgi:hypothetical protein
MLSTSVSDPLPIVTDRVDGGGVGLLTLAGAETRRMELHHLAKSTTALKRLFPRRALLRAEHYPFLLNGDIWLKGKEDVGQPDENAPCRG